jgi:hypothetical protein
MAELKRVRLEEDLQQYLETQAQRILGKTPEKLTSVDYSTLVNRALYEHKLAQGITCKMPLGRLLDWVLNLTSSARNLSLIPQGRAGESAMGKASPEAIPQAEPDDYSLDFQLGELFEQEAA